MKEDKKMTKTKNIKFRKGWNYFLNTPVSSLVLAIIVSAILVKLLGYDPFETFGYIIYGAFGSWNNIVATMSQMTPVLFCGLSYLLARKCGLSNMGMEGQYLMGAFSAAVIGIYIPDWFLVFGPVVPLLVAALFGAVIAFIPVILKRTLQSNEMLISLMINYALLFLCQYLVNYTFMDPNNIIPVTSPVKEKAYVGLIVPGSQLTYGFLLAVVITAILHFFFYRTVPGYKVRAVGANKSVALHKGLNIGRIQMWTYIIAGAIAGIGGGCQVLGVHHYYIHGMTTNYGWDGIAAALLGGGEPIGNFFGSLVYGALRAGGLNLSRMTDVNSDFIFVIEGVMLLFIATPELMRRFTVKIETEEEKDEE